MLTGNTTAIEADAAALAENNRPLKADAEMLECNHALLGLITAKPGVQ